MKLKKILAVTLAILIYSTSVSGVNIDFLEKTKLSEKALLQTVVSMAVTEDGLILLVDFKAANIKVYRKDGTFVKTIGERGYGPNEFLQPLNCHYYDGIFTVADVGQKNIFVYKRKDKESFDRIKKVHVSSVGEDIHLDGKTLFLAASKTAESKISYFLYSFDIEKESDYNYLLPAYLKYGLKSDKEYKSTIRTPSEYKIVGQKGFFDVHKKFAYYSWSGDLKVFKINLKTNEITSFGEKPPRYVKPKANQKLFNAYASRQFKTIMAERRKMSYVKQIFTTNKHVFVIYTLPDETGEKPINIAQFYSLSGDYIGEVKVPGKAGTTYFDKKNNILSAVVFEEIGEDNDEHYIYQYKITE